MTFSGCWLSTLHLKEAILHHMMMNDYMLCTIRVIYRYLCNASSGDMVDQNKTFRVSLIYGAQYIYITYKVLNLNYLESKACSSLYLTERHV